MRGPSARHIGGAYSATCGDMHYFLNCHPPSLIPAICLYCHPPSLIPAICLYCHPPLPDSCYMFILSSPPSLMPALKITWIVTHLNVGSFNNMFH